MNYERDLSETVDSSFNFNSNLYDFIVFSLQTYYVSQRPYVGIFDINTQVERDEKNVPLKMTWQFIIKNTGKVPALVTTEKHVCQLKQGERNIPFPGIGSVGKTTLVLSDQSGRLLSSFFGDVLGAKVEDVLNGKVILTCDTELSYTTISWWLNSKYVYRANYRFTPAFTSFVMDSGFAD
jgi:hypothetical protein